MTDCCGASAVPPVLLANRRVPAARPSRDEAIRRGAAVADCLAPGCRRTPMVKLVFCLHRLPALSREEFQRYWRERHGPLVRESAKALGIRRHVQVHTLATPER